MTDPEIQDIANRVIAALQALAPAPAGWWVPWTAWGSYGALLVAGVALVVGVRTLRQKRQADAKSEWWRRTQWALEATASTDGTMYAYGTGMLDILATSKLADKEDKELLDTVWRGTATEMEPREILNLITLAARQPDLTRSEAAVLDSFDDKPLDVDDQAAQADNGSSEVEPNGG